MGKCSTQTPGINIILPDLTDYMLY